MTLAIPFSLKTMELVQIGFATHFEETPLASMLSESNIANIIATLTLTFAVNGPLEPIHGACTYTIVVTGRGFRKDLPQEFF